MFHAELKSISGREYILSNKHIDGGIFLRNLKVAVTVTAALVCAAAVGIGIILTGIKRSYEIVNRNDIYK